MVSEYFNIESCWKLKLTMVLFPTLGTAIEDGGIG